MTETIHPEVVGVANCGGHWSKYLPIASKRGKGVCFEWLMPHELKYIDGPSANLDECVKVKVYKV